jgi:hypothetical protein
MMAMPMPPDGDDNAASPVTSYPVQNVTPRWLHAQEHP